MRTEIPAAPPFGQFQVRLAKLTACLNRATLPESVAVKSGEKIAHYVLGIDFGTLSGRALLVNTRTGEEVAWADHNYKSAVIEESLPGSKKRLKPLTALQDPADYIEVLHKAVPQVMRRAKAKPEQVLGIGVDFTSCTMLPTLADGTPLCSLKKWRNNSHAWVKLWKHHAAQPEANRINKVGSRRKEDFITAYGGKYSSEWFFAKILETVREAPEVYDAAERFIEAGDWLVWQLTGMEKRSLSAAGFKAMRVNRAKRGGWTYPGKVFFKTLNAKLANVVANKLESEIIALGSKAGELTHTMAKAMGLRAGTPVAAANIDAHAAVPACTVTDAGKLVMIMGTSTCHLLAAKHEKPVEGICGVVQDGVIPGFWGYEAGQSGVGDVFAWYVQNGIPTEIGQAAKKAKQDIYQYLESEAARLKPAESGLLALDWWNGNRSVLVDADLSGLLVGQTLATRPHEIYRALLEATAFGTRQIIEAFTSQGVDINELYACGGLAIKNPLMLQIYSDVTGRPIRIAASEQASALGAAMYGAVAAGVYSDISQAAKKMARVRRKIYRPNARHKKTYDLLYREYKRLHDQFGRDPNSSMKVLKKLRNQALGY